MGTYFHRCRLTEVPTNGTFWAMSDDLSICSPDGGGAFVCPSGQWCGHPHEFNIALADEGVYDRAEINYSIATFDNFMKALFTVF